MYEVCVSKKDGNQFFSIVEEKWEKLDDALKRAKELIREYDVKPEKVVYQRSDERFFKFRSLIWIGKDHIVAIDTESRHKFKEFDRIARNIADEIQTL